MADRKKSTLDSLAGPSPSQSRGQRGSSRSGQSTGSNNIRHTSLDPSLSASNDSTRSKQNFRNITRILLPPPSQELQLEDLFEFDPLEPQKFSPGETKDSGPKMSNGTNHSREPLVSNRFREERYTQFADMFEGREQTPTRSPAKHRPAALDVGRKLPGLGQSQSDLGLRYYGLHGGLNVSRLDTSVSSRNGFSRNHENSLNSPPPSPVRGRGTDRTPSPIKHMEKIREDSAYDPKDNIKRSRSPIKHLFGYNGLLSRSGSSTRLPNDTVLRNGVKNWFGKVKQRIGESSVDLSKVVHHESPRESYTTTKFAISLDPPAQAKLYSEIELMICATANQYLLIQHKEGRMSVESVIKVTQFWCNKNRPQVIEFQFDQATQRDLVLHNMETFRFYGPNAHDGLKINAMMQSWKTLAKEMGVRTFCTPDSVVKKHMHDCYKVLELLGAPVVTFLAFQSIQIKALDVIQEEQRRQEEYDSIEFGVERRWEPPERVNMENEGIRNPFE